MKVDMNKILNKLSKDRTIDAYKLFDLMRLLHIDAYSIIVNSVSNMRMLNLIRDCISKEDLIILDRNITKEISNSDIERDSKYELNINNRFEGESNPTHSTSKIVELLSEGLNIFFNYISKSKSQIESKDVHLVLDRLINSDVILKKRIEYLVRSSMISKSQIIEYVKELNLLDWSDIMKGRLYSYLKKRFKYELPRKILSKDQHFRVGKDCIKCYSFIGKSCKMIIDQIDKCDDRGYSMTGKVLHHITINSDWVREITPYLLRLMRKLQTRHIRFFDHVLLRLAPIFEIPEYIERVSSKYSGVGGDLIFELNKNRDKIIVRSKEKV